MSVGNWVVEKLKFEKNKNYTKKQEENIPGLIFRADSE